MKLNNKFAIGCLIQWYEIELVGEYLQSVKNALDIIENKKNINRDVDAERGLLSNFKVLSDNYLSAINNLYNNKIFDNFIGRYVDE